MKTHHNNYKCRHLSLSCWGKIINFFFLAKHTKTGPKSTLRTEEETFTPAFINNQQAKTVSSSKKMPESSRAELQDAGCFQLQLSLLRPTINSCLALWSILVLWPGGWQRSWSVNFSDGVPTVYFMLHWHNLMCDTLSVSSSHQTCYPTYLFTQKRRASRPLLGHSPVADHKLGPRLTSRAKTNRIQHFSEAQCYSITFVDSRLRTW